MLGGKMIDLQQFEPKIDAGNYAVYNIIQGRATEEKWSVAVLEIHDSPKHYHKIEKEMFIVLNGELDIEIDGEHQQKKVGELVVIMPSKIHQLKSALSEPVRVLCVNFPAFDPVDMHYVVEEK